MIPSSDSVSCFPFFAFSLIGGRTMDKIFSPGEFISYSEEYGAGQNAFEDDDKVYASAVGKLVEDKVRRRAGIASLKKIRLIKEGDLVDARVEDVYEQIALLSFEPVQGGKEERKRIEAEVIASFTNTAYLRVSELRDEFVEGFRDNIGIGDILKARVREVTSMGIYLTITDEDLGVTRAFCSNCRKELKQQAGEQWFCAECGRTEYRKTPFVKSKAGEPSARGGRRAFKRFERKPQRFRRGERDARGRHGKRGERWGQRRKQ